MEQGGDNCESDAQGWVVREESGMEGCEGNERGEVSREEMQPGVGGVEVVEGMGW